MTSSPTQANFYTTSSETTKDESDLRQLAGCLSRHHNLIALVTGLSIFISGIYALTRKPVWEGHFQIVVENEDSGSAKSLSSVISSSQVLSSITGSGSNKLETEVKILESPSVLQPTYNFVKAYKTRAGENIRSLTFHDWRDKNLKIALEKGTSVLNISYRDTDPKVVLPVIKKISNDYQRYSGRDRSKSISNGLAYTLKQVKQYRQKAAKSSRALDAFSIRYGIANSGESVRQLDPTTSIARDDALSKLAGINQELIRRQQQFTSRDPGILALVRERDALRRYIEVTAGGSLTLPGQQPTNKEQPQELLLQFKELNREAKRDITTLDLLERSLMSLQLEQARQTDPWELISTPTLLDKPVAPHKRRIVAFGLLAGLILGSGAALWVDHRTGLVYSEDELKSLLPCPLLNHLPAVSGDAWTDVAELLAAGPLAKAPKNIAIALIPVGHIPKDQLQEFNGELSRALEGRELLVSTDLRQTSRCATQLLLTSPGAATRTKLTELRQKLALQGTPLAGWVLLNPGLNLK